VGLLEGHEHHFLLLASLLPFHPDATAPTTVLRVSYEVYFVVLGGAGGGISWILRGVLVKVLL
jgi:hypothetical protein